MRSSIAACVIFLCAVSAASADEFPRRTPGLWEVSITSEAGTHATKQCVDEKTDAQLLQMGSRMGQMCTKNETRKEGASFVSESDCTMAGTKIHARSVMSGDFASAYQGEVHVTYNPPLRGKSEGDTKISARRLGACEAGQRPGDIIMPDGKAMNIDMLSKMGR